MYLKKKTGKTFLKNNLRLYKNTENKTTMIESERNGEFFYYIYHNADGYSSSKCGEANELQVLTPIAYDFCRPLQPVSVSFPVKHPRASSVPGEG